MDIDGVLVQLLKSQPKENVLMIITSADDTELESLWVFKQQSIPASQRKISLALAVTVM